MPFNYHLGAYTLNATAALPCRAAAGRVWLNRRPRASMRSISASDKPGMADLVHQDVG